MEAVMTTRRSDAPLQTDPIRDHLGKPGVARDVRCPNCGVIHATSRRWQMRCPECRHAWIDRSQRTLIDKLRDVRLEVFVAVLGVVTIIGALAFLAVWVGWLFAEAADQRGWNRTYGLAAFFIGCILSLAVLAYTFRHSHR